MDQHRVTYKARVGAEFGVSLYREKRVTVRLDEENDWEIVASPTLARELARRLKKAADLLDPPKKRR